MNEEDEAFEDLAKRQGDWGMQGSRKHQIMRYAENVESNAVIDEVAKAVLAEREACAKLCDSFYESWINIYGRYEFMGEGAQECAAAIRAREQA